MSNDSSNDLMALVITLAIIGVVLMIIWYVVIGISIVGSTVGGFLGVRNYAIAFDNNRLKDKKF